MRNLANIFLVCPSPTKVWPSKNIVYSASTLFSYYGSINEGPSKQIPIHYS